ncbi:S24 family peptidase [uncultured Psychrobacter sp.]|uniref:S24 family peptidase n=2 Tax=Moraxellaceae TaxID=468 RepID=UPI0030D7BEF0|tara:strand:- start:3885 stop:4598 length:714 start_codon:yes stop_codon:yes gene_type:complete
MDPSMLRLQEIAGTNKKSKIALDLNVGASTVTNWAKRGVSKEGALAAAEKYNADANYILSGMSGKPSVSDLRAQIQKMQSTTPPPSIDTPEGTKKVPVDYGMSGQMPVISWVAAGSFADVMPVTIDDAIEWIDRPSNLSPRAFGLIIEGRSMWPEFKPGEIIYVEPNISPLELKDGALVVIHCNDDKQATFKQLIIGDSPEDMYLKPLNPDWPDQKIIPMGECMLVGVVDSKVTRYR